MNRLIKGAENSLSASSELFAKASKETTGDLASNMSNKAGTLLGRSREDVFFNSAASNALGEDTEEQDFTDQTPVQEIPLIISPSSSSQLKPKETEIKPPIHRYSQLIAGTLHTIDQLYTQSKNLEFRNIFRLPFEESIINEELGCCFHSQNSFAGNIYLTQSYFCFTSTPTTSAMMSEESCSQIFESTYDPVLYFLVPYAHIVSITKQPPTVLPTSLKLTSLSLSGYLVVSTKNKLEFFFSFSSLKNRDKLSDILFQKIKSIDWKFDDDIMIGVRNGGQGGNTLKASTNGYEFTSAMKNLKGRKSLASMEDLLTPETPNSQGILGAGLKYRFKLPSMETSEEEGALSEKIWNDYFITGGKDVCMVKDLSALRNLLIKTYGAPNRLRGDFW